MKIDQKKAQQLAAIQAELLAAFSDFCNQAAAPEVQSLLRQFREHRLSLVFTVTASMEETNLFCGTVPTGGSPNDMKALFTVYSPVAHQSTRGMH